MRIFSFCAVCLFFALSVSSADADIIIDKDGHVVEVGRDAIKTGDKIQITDCKTGRVVEFDSAKFGYRKGKDCKDDSRDKIPLDQSQKF